FLCRVNNGGEAKAISRCKWIYVVDGDVRIALGDVWNDSNRPDTTLMQRLRLCHDAGNGCLHIGTVIADEDCQRAFRPTDVSERIDLAVDTLKSEVTCLPADRVGCVRHHQVFSAIGTHCL